MSKCRASRFDLMGIVAASLLLGLGALTGSLAAAEFPFNPDRNLIVAPNDQAGWPACGERSRRCSAGACGCTSTITRGTPARGWKPSPTSTCWWIWFAHCRWTAFSWTPLVPTEQKNVFASLWEGEGLRLWTLVNQNAQPVSGTLLKIPDRPEQAVFDLVAGGLLRHVRQRLAVDRKERTDGRTRFCIIRGGAYFSAQGSNWYVDGGPRPVNFATKFLLMWPGLDRCGAIGFRCVVDLTP